MTRWWRRAFLIIGLLVALSGGIAGSGLLVAIGIVMVLVALLPTRADSSRPTSTSDSPLVEAEGHTWMQQPCSAAFQRNHEPTPEVIRNQRAIATAQTHTASKALAVVLALAGAGAQIPGMSPVVCSLKGGTWHNGSSVIVPAGCYPREQP